MPGVPVTAKARAPAFAVIPGGTPSKYYFDGTPKAGIPAGEGRRQLSPAVAPAEAGAPGGERRLRSSPAGVLAFARTTPSLRLAPLLLLAGCAAAQSAAAVQPQAPGFLLGLWHGFIFPVAWIVSLFMPDVGIYAVPNNGGWYDFGYFLGIVVFGVGARKSAVGIHGARRTHVHRGTTVHQEERG